MTKICGLQSLVNMLRYFSLLKPSEEVLILGYKSIVLRLKMLKDAQSLIEGCASLDQWQESLFALEKSCLMAKHLKCAQAQSFTLEINFVVQAPTLGKEV